jgi:dolichol-phosphate mannosyltransferase
MSTIAVPYAPPAAELDGVAAGRRLPSDAPNLFVIPAYNEAENLPRLITDLEARPALFPDGSRVIVVDDGSTDGTPEVVAGYDGELSLQLVRLERNEGPGAAFRAGFAAALDAHAGDALVVTLEADTTGDLDALPALIERALAGAELVVADWVMVNVSRLRRILTAGAARLVRRALGVEARTVSSFFRVYRASALRAAGDRYGDGLIRESGFACKAELLTKLAALGARIEEVPVGLDTSRRIGESKMPILRTTFAYWRMIARERLGREVTA